MSAHAYADVLGNNVVVDSWYFMKYFYRGRHRTMNRISKLVNNLAEKIYYYATATC